MASRTSSRARRTRVSAGCIANVLANGRSGQEDLDNLFTVDDLLEENYHNDEDGNSDRADINDDQTDGGLLEQNAVN